MKAGSTRGRLGRSRKGVASGHSMIHSASVGPQSSLFNDFYSLFRPFNDRAPVARSPCTTQQSAGLFDDSPAVPYTARAAVQAFQRKPSIGVG